jgi:hypothetical protein
LEGEIIRLTARVNELEATEGKWWTTSIQM